MSKVASPSRNHYARRLALSPVISSLSRLTRLTRDSVTRRQRTLSTFSPSTPSPSTTPDERETCATSPRSTISLSMKTEHPSFAVEPTREAEKDLARLRPWTAQATQAILRLEQQPYLGHSLTA